MLIHTLATVAVTIFTLAGITLGVAAGADALDTKAVPRAVGVAILALTVLLFAIILVWLFQPGVIA